MQYRLRNSFHFRLMVSFLAVSLIPLCLCSALLVQIASVHMNREIKENMKTDSDSMIVALDDLALGFEDVGKALQNNPVLMDALTCGLAQETQIYNVLYEAAGSIREVCTLHIYDLKGNPLFSSHSSPQPQKLKPTWGVLNAARTSGNTVETARYTSYRDMASIYNDFAARAKSLMTVSSMFYTFNVDGMQSWADTLWPTQKRILEQVLISARILLSSLEGSIDFADDEFDNLENFLKLRIRSAVFQKPAKEIEVQNVIETLLLGRGLAKGTDYDRESGKFEFSGKEYIPDFIMDLGCTPMRAFLKVELALFSI